MSATEYINGTAPVLAGRTCQAFICQQFFADGRLEGERTSLSSSSMGRLLRHVANERLGAGFVRV